MSLLPSKPDATPAEDAGPRVIGVDTDDADDVLAALSAGTARELLAALHDEPAPPSELADEVDTSLQNAQYHLDKLKTAGAVEVVDTAYSAKGREMDVYAPADQPLVIFAGDDEKGSTLRTALTRLLGAVGILALGSLAVQAMFGQRDFLGGLIAAPGGDGAPEAGGDGGDGGYGAADGATRTPATTPAEEGTMQVAIDGGDGGDAATTSAREAVTGTGTPAPSPTVTQAPEPTATITGTPADGVDALRTTVEAGAPGGIPPGLVFFAGGLFVLAVVAVVLTVRQ